MELQKTIFEDLSAVIGFTATMRLAVWLGSANGRLYVPKKPEEGQLLVKLIGMKAAERLTQEWGGEHLHVPKLTGYEKDVRNKLIGGLLEAGISTREIGARMGMTERRVQQICRELELAGLINIVGPPKKSGRKRPVKNGV